MKTLSVKLPEARQALLCAAAKSRGATKSDIMREALRAYLNAEQFSCADLAGDLIGCVEGPGDLSTNQKHMEGFGRSSVLMKK